MYYLSSNKITIIAFLWYISASYLMDAIRKAQFKILLSHEMLKVVFIGRCIIILSLQWRTCPMSSAYKILDIPI